MKNNREVFLNKVRGYYVDGEPAFVSVDSQDGTSYNIFTLVIRRNSEAGWFSDRAYEYRKSLFEKVAVHLASDYGALYGFHYKTVGDLPVLLLDDKKLSDSTSSQAVVFSIKDDQNATLGRIVLSVGLKSGQCKVREVK
jgi:hypothetical protein